MVGKEGCYQVLKSDVSLRTHMLGGGKQCLQVVLLYLHVQCGMYTHKLIIK